MKVVPQGSVSNSNKKRHVIPPIPFERYADDTKSLQKHEYLTFKLRSVPTAADSPVYELSVPFFNKGSFELYLITLHHLGEIIVGQNISDAPGMYALARRVSKVMLWQLSTLLQLLLVQRRLPTINKPYEL
jgi:hypothetical protein